MYEYIKGIYAGFNKDYIIIENNGIGYKIYTSGSTLAKMPASGEEVLLYVHQIVRQDFIGLYGFLTKEELSMFDLLLTITGIGAKAALSLLSISSTVNLKYAIINGDEKTIIRAPGIGNKTAQRIILELRDKMKHDIIEKNFTGDSGSTELGHGTHEALEALISLGYTEREAQKALKEVDLKGSIEVVIKNCLKKLMS